MAGDNESQVPKASKQTGATTSGGAESSQPAAEEHYEVVAEYRIGEGPPPIALVVMFVLIVLWASVSWVPFFGY